MTPTPQQAAFVAELVTGTSHVALRARAGTGKTTTILQGIAAALAANPRLEILFCAFNKKNADEGAERLKELGLTDWRQVSAATAHSMGFGLVRFAFKPVVDDKKVWKLIEAQNESLYQTYGPQIHSLVKFAKDAGFGFFSDKQIGDNAAWYALADHFDVNGLDDTSDADEVVAAAQKIYRASLAQTGVVDYADMILFPLVKNLRVKFQKDIVIVDECQDMSPARQALVKKFVKVHGGRLVVVGDEAQSLYGFSGADAAAMENLIRDMGAAVMPLSVSFRCPKAVVRLAQTFVPDIEAAENAAEGLVHSLAALPEDLAPGDAVLCRNTKPLISTAYRLIRAGKPCKVEGRAIGEGLIQMCRRWKVRTIDAFLNKLDVYRDREIQKAQAKGNDAKIEEIEDRVGTMVEICSAVTSQGKTSIDDVIAFIENLFADGATNVIVLATGHRSKGREWPRVFILPPSAKPRRMQAWQEIQERNIKYVMCTRAQRELVFIGG